MSAAWAWASGLPTEVPPNFIANVVTIGILSPSFDSGVKRRRQTELSSPPEK
jgi:hypothetical protein